VRSGSIEHAPSEKIEVSRSATDSGRHGALHGPGRGSIRSWPIWIAIDDQWCIGTVGVSPALIGVRIVKRNVGNAPARQSNGQNVRAPSSSRPETLYFKS